MLVDDQARLFYTDVTAKALMELDEPGGDPTPLVAGIAELGGLAQAPDGHILVGVGDGIGTGASGNLNPTAKILDVDPYAKQVKTLASGLQMSNGVARAADGTLYASSDAGLGIDRVTPGGTVTNNWAHLITPNGLAFDPTGRYLYAAQTFQPAAIARIDTHTAQVETYAQAGPLDAAAGPDGLTVGSDGTVYVAANNAKEVWRVNADRSICALAKNVGNVSSLSFGTEYGDGGFSSSDLFVVSFGGKLIQLQGVQAPKPIPTDPTGSQGPVPPSGPPGQELLIKITPRHATAGRRTVFTITTRRRIGRLVQPIRALVRFAGHNLRTNTKGRLRFAYRPRAKGKLVVTYRGRGDDVPIAVVTVGKPRS